MAQSDQELESGDMFTAETQSTLRIIFKRNLTADPRRLTQMKNGKEQSAKRIASILSDQLSAFSSGLITANCLLPSVYSLRLDPRALLS